MQEYFLFVGLFLASTLGTVLDAVLGVSKALESLPKWKVSVHETFHMILGVALYKLIQLFS